MIWSSDVEFNRCIPDFESPERPVIILLGVRVIGNLQISRIKYINSHFWDLIRERNPQNAQ